MRPFLELQVGVSNLFPLEVFCGQSYRVKDEITAADLGIRTQHVIGREIDVIRSQLSRNHVAVLSGMGHFVDPHTVGVVDEHGHETKATADKIIIATGTRPARPDTVEFDDHAIIDSDGILKLQDIPDSMVVVGAGVIGIEYASMFAALGTKVTVVERRDRMLDGMLKLLVSPETRALLGVHVFGTGATELLHIGQAVMGCGGTIDYLVDAVFNYPTLAESYKVAALDAMNKLRRVARFEL
ncbi:FAD-dependent oxidoreductase [Streptosporangium sp. CA-115845]|uniref:FAD-dependent oxidoreductase n=1 Tax=Streptosporangium sp. CA-115845 TaxID=3240071 RepID=UPI003D925A89